MGWFVAYARICYMFGFSEWWAGETNATLKISCFQSDECTWPRLVKILMKKRHLKCNRSCVQRVYIVSVFIHLYIDLCKSYCTWIFSARSRLWFRYILYIQVHFSPSLSLPSVLLALKIHTYYRYKRKKILYGTPAQSYIYIHSKRRKSRVYVQ